MGYIIHRLVDMKNRIFDRTLLVKMVVLLVYYQAITFAYTAFLWYNHSIRTFVRME